MLIVYGVDFSDITHIFFQLREWLNNCTIGARRSTIIKCRWFFKRRAILSQRKLYFPLNIALLALSRVSLCPRGSARAIARDGTHVRVSVSLDPHFRSTWSNEQGHEVSYKCFEDVRDKEDATDLVSPQASFISNRRFFVAFFGPDHSRIHTRRNRLDQAANYSRNRARSPRTVKSRDKC